MWELRLDRCAWGGVDPGTGAGVTIWLGAGARLQALFRLREGLRRWRDGTLSPLSDIAAGIYTPSATPGGDVVTILSALLLVMPAATQSEAKLVTVDDMRRQTHAIQGQLVRTCGEVSSDGTVIYSDTIYPIHGRVGVKLRGYAGRGRDQCVTGRLHRMDGRPAAETQTILVTDAAIHPDYVFVAGEADHAN